MTCPEWQTDAGKLTIPVGKYKGVLGYIVLDESGVTIHKKILFRTVERKIPYDQVAKVAYEKGTEKKGAFICIRSMEDRSRPLTNRGNDGIDETAMRFVYTDNEAMERVAKFLEKAAQDNVEKLAMPIAEDAHEESSAQELTIPVGKYQGTEGYLFLDEEAATIHKKPLFSEVMERRIPYDQVAKVGFSKDGGYLNGGFISIRSIEDRYIPLVGKAKASSDATSLNFIPAESEAMERAAKFLEKAAQDNAEKLAMILAEDAKKIPVGKYQGTMGYLVLDESTVTIHKTTPMDVTERQIPFSQVVRVAFEKETDQESCGFISIRSAEEWQIPLAGRGSTGSDETSLSFRYMQNETMQRVAEFLKNIAQENAERLGIPAAEEIMQQEKGEKLCCPQCMSRNIRCQARRSRSYVRTRVYTTPMARLIGSIIVLIATIVSVCVKEYWYTCQECGFQWTSKEK